MKLALAAFVFIAGSAMPAAASPAVICAEPPASPSVIYYGDACDFAEPAPVADEEVASAGDGNAPLVNQLGMPTSMPVVMRPSLDVVPSEGTAPAESPATTAAAPVTNAAPETAVAPAGNQQTAATPPPQQPNAPAAAVQ